MKYLSSLLFTLLFFAACTSDENMPPADVLPKEKMVLILGDIHLAESGVSSQELGRDTSVFLYRALEKQVFEKHGVSQADFLKSYQWYSEHVKAYKELYVTVVDSLNAKSPVVK
jgi:hypothetical protein